MPVAILADAHLGGPGGSAAPLLRQLEELEKKRCERLVVLGDLFQVWVGDRRFETPEIARVVSSLAAVRERGVRVDYIEGNRDFFLAHSIYRRAFDSIASELSFGIGGKSYLAVHGDGLDDRDWNYRLWRSLSKSRLSRLLIRLVPRPIAAGLIHSTERRLARTNFKHKVRIPEEVIRRYAEQRLAEGHDILVLGHFHQPRRWRVGDGEVRLLEAWFNTRRLEWVGNSNP